MTDSEVLARRLLAWFNAGDKHTRPKSLTDASKSGDQVTEILSTFLMETDHYAEVCQAFPAEIRAEEIEESSSTIDGILNPEDET